MTYFIDVQFALDKPPAHVPGPATFSHWARTALREHADAAELTVRVVDAAEMVQLNQDYRGKDGTTNVLSFPIEDLPDPELALLGDVVICADVVAAEAAAQRKPVEAHWAHMTVHGVLHLLGYDHINDDDARLMEAREVKILTSLGYTDPYLTMDTL
ncbi:MAG: rRNA maturation RNase YbeY [Gammaproteobacteria bacterium]|nr:rRNA maturation RNase YbeY [Gammaproteobacteria bacterium]